MRIHAFCRGAANIVPEVFGIVVRAVRLETDAWGGRTRTGSAGCALGRMGGDVEVSIGIAGRAAGNAG